MLSEADAREVWPHSGRRRIIAASRSTWGESPPDNPSLGLARYQSQFATQWADLSAASIMVSIPIVILFVYISKYLVSGLTLGGVKG